PTPVYVVPLVWKLHFEREVSAELAAEMSHTERVLALPSGSGLAVERRFAKLMIQVLLAQRARFLGPEAPSPPITEHNFFEAQRSFADRLLSDLEARHGPSEGDLAKRVFA